MLLVLTTATRVDETDLTVVLDTTTAEEDLTLAAATDVALMEVETAMAVELATEAAFVVDEITATLEVVVALVTTDDVTAVAPIPAEAGFQNTAGV